MTPDPGQLPYLLRLLDDDSPDVRGVVMSQFAAFGDSLEDLLRNVALPEHPGQRRLIQSLLREGRRRRLSAGWAGLGAVEGDKARLEAGQELISRFLRTDASAGILPAALDELAREFRGGLYEQDALALSEFLFQIKGLAGAREAYYSPGNSDLLQVITKREGLPISLVCIYMLVAHRLGMSVEGCNLPGHFLALALHGGRKFVVDCYSGGIVLLDSDLARLSSAAPVMTTDLTALECDARVILARVLRNLGAAFRRCEDEQAAQDAALVDQLAAAGIP
ncbi:MAG TPA: transglutaminase-like domain-containing protein [Bacteroidota bacterium]|nr:transglutaminase-like domain-containing protein [Bacteroidota bacterium]